MIFQDFLKNYKKKKPWLSWSSYMKNWMLLYEVQVSKIPIYEPVFLEQHISVILSSSQIQYHNTVTFLKPNGIKCYTLRITPILQLFLVWNIIIKLHDFSKLQELSCFAFIDYEKGFDCRPHCDWCQARI